MMVTIIASPFKLLFLILALYSILFLSTHQCCIKGLYRIDAKKHKLLSKQLFTKKRRKVLKKRIKVIQKRKFRSIEYYNDYELGKTEIFIIINCRNASFVHDWLHDCKPPACAFQVFVDRSEDFTTISNSISTVEYPKGLQDKNGYSNFGHRGRFQMKWAFENANFDYLVKVDDDGYLCIDHLLYTLRHNKAPKEKFIFGRFWCKIEFPRADENFLTMSSDAVGYYVRGWDQGLLKFNGKLTLGVMIGIHLSRLHHTCGWTFWSDQKRLRWWETMKPKHGCNSHIWFHHVNPGEIKELHQRHKHEPFDEHLVKNVTLFKNHTGCPRFDAGLLHPAAEKISRLAIVKEKKEGMLKVAYINFTSDVTPPCEI